MMSFGISELLFLIFCGLAALGLLAGGVVLIIWLVRRSNKAFSESAQAPGSPAAALSLAQERYARGEITREQYQQIVEDLNQR
jgi:putative membrane protein